VIFKVKLQQREVLITLPIAVLSATYIFAVYLKLEQPLWFQFRI